MDEGRWITTKNGYRVFIKPTKSFMDSFIRQKGGIKTKEQVEKQISDIDKKIKENNEKFKEEEKKHDLNDPKQFEEMRQIYEKHREEQDQLEQQRLNYHKELANLKDADKKQEVEKYYNDNIKKYEVEVQKMIDGDITRDKDNLAKFKEEYAKEKAEMQEYVKTLSYHEKYYGNNKYTEWREKIRRSYYHQVMNRSNNENEQHLFMMKDIFGHYDTLQKKVEDKIGKIQRLNHHGGSDYTVYGSNGQCELEVILAGGYNIQRLHTRWIIKKNSKYEEE